MSRNVLFLLLYVLFYEAVAVGVEQLAEFFYLFLNLTAFVGIADSNAATHHLYDLRAALDVCPVGNGFQSARKWLVLNELESAAVIDERIACNARGVMV